MKVLIGCGGADAGRAALHELKSAGLPCVTEILVISVSEVWLPPTELGSLPGTALSSHRVMATFTRLQSEAEGALKLAEEMAVKAAAQIKLDYPNWLVQAEFVSGDAALTLLEKAADWGADLIIVGTSNRSALGEVFLGSVTKTVVTEAACSVRVARGGSNTDDLAPRRLIAGIDNTNCADSVINAIAGRNWAPGSEVLMLAAIEAFAEHEIPAGEQLTTLEGIQRAAAAKLGKAGLRASISVKGDGAKSELLREAEKWNADCIFIGSRNIQGVLNRFLHGSVSTDVATDAICSVEVVRTPEGLK